MKRRRLALLLAALLLAAAIGCGTVTNEANGRETAASAAPVETADTEEGARKAEGNLLSIYWTASSIDFEKSDVWIWYDGKDGRGYPFRPCAYGAVCEVDVPKDVSRVGFIVRKNCSDPCGTAWGTATKDFDSDRFVAVTGDTEIYLKTGDGAIYLSEDGGVNLYQKKEFSYAGIVAENQIKYRIEPATAFTELEQIAVYRNGERMEIAQLSSLNNAVVTGTITLKDALDITASYEVELEGFGRRTAVPTDIFDTEAFERAYAYDGDDLGAYIGADGKTTFKVWAPTASKVVLNLFQAGDGEDAYAAEEMERGQKGVWSISVECGHGTYYTYTVTTAVGTQEAVDPYAKAVGVNGERGMVIDLASTDPEGFRTDAFSPKLGSYRDALIWEVHVRDFSNRIAASQYPGKYLAFTETGLTNAAGVPIGVDYLKSLGVTHVHLQPIYDFATVDETKTEDRFNWGYDPKNYNAPEGSYSTDPYRGEVRVNEVKRMVKALHDNGLAVVMDVVYNHTYDANANLNRIVPYYYYRYTPLGENANGSGCGNETASERAMFRKFMVDSVTYWQKEYRIDGFRFDLMALHDLDTMQAIEAAVHAADPQAILYGEGWTGGTTPLNPSRQATQQNIRRVLASEGAIGGIAVFNDAIRDGLKGSVFDAKAIGYISGDASKQNAAKVLFGITGGGYAVGAAWQVDDALMINYMSSHDNRTLWDILCIGAPNASTERRLEMNRLGAAAVLLSKGTPFWLAGEEMLRTKDGDENSYRSSDAVNNLDWEALTPDGEAYAMVEYYRALIALRKANDWIKNADVTGEIVQNNALAVTYAADGSVRGYALFNPNDEPLLAALPAGEWTGLFGAEGTLSGTVTVPAKGVLLVRAGA